MCTFRVVHIQTGDVKDTKLFGKYNCVHLNVHWNKPVFFTGLFSTRMSCIDMLKVTTGKTHVLGKGPRTEPFTTYWKTLSPEFLLVAETLFT